MIRNTVVRSLAVACVLAASAGAVAQDFPIFGPRNLSMGRSGVASVADVSAVYVNPAALARDGFARAGLYVGAGVRSPVDIEETEDIINNIVRTVQDFTPQNASQSIQFLSTEINRLDEDLVGAGYAQGLIGVGLGRSFTLSYSERWVSDILISVDRVRLSTIIFSPNFVGFNQTRGDAQLSRFQQLALTFATSFLDDHLRIGVTGIGGYATTYSLNETIFSLALRSMEDEIDWEDEVRSNRETSYYFDAVAGVQLNLCDDKLVLGITGTHLLSPAIARRNRDDYHLDPQARVAVAWSPFYEERRVESAPDEGSAGDGSEGEMGPGPVTSIYNPLTLTLGYDLTKNESILEGGIDSRYIGGGIEYAPKSWLAIRAGVFANLEKTNLGHTITGGLQLSALELGVAWSTKKNGDYSNDVRAEVGFSVTF